MMPLKTVKVDDNGFIDIKEFEDLVDISKVEFYSLEELDGVVNLCFYDKNKEPVRPYLPVDKK